MTSEYWQNIYKSKEDNEVSWTQEYPNSAIKFLQSLRLPYDANIIDVGGGASKFADALLDLGYSNISVLDISEAALARSKKRIGAKARAINWIVADINEFASNATYDFWYDRAVFHFLTKGKMIANYVQTVSSAITANGHFLLGTFSENGPKKCSGLEVTQYSETKMKDTFNSSFQAIECFQELHTTPFNTTQEFQFCGFKKK